MPTSSNNTGFTLVELAIVMTIIGLLIGGVLKGRQMIQNAKITSTISQVQAYKAALTTFLDRYNQFPGDTALATRRIPGCTPAQNCYDGDGNSFVGQPNASAGIYQGGVTTLPQVETAMFWKHLALTNLISGIQPGADPTAPSWGATHPSASIGGGFHVYHQGTGTVNKGHWLSLQKMANAAGYPHPGAGNGPLSPIAAAQIDRKMDDGKSSSGFVMGGTAQGSTLDSTNPNRCAQGTAANHDYANLKTKNCLLYFSIF